jgi:hypothetical protein
MLFVMRCEAGGAKQVAVIRISHLNGFSELL